MLKRGISFLLLVAFLITLLPIGYATGECDTLQKLFDTYAEESGQFSLDSTARLYFVTTQIPSEAELARATLITQEFAAKGFAAMPIKWGSERGTNSADIRLLSDTALPQEGFSAEIMPDGIFLRYHDTNGLLYGLRAVLKLFITSGGNQISACRFSDAPDTPERTLMLDCARKYWSVEWIKNLIRELSWQGFNALELHLTEDQGIHADIWTDSEGNVVPDVNGNDFSWLPGYKAAGWASNSASGANGVAIEDPNGACNYTRDDLISILDCAKQYAIEIIPSVDFPGHSDYLIDRWTRSDACEDFTFQYGGETYAERPSALYIQDSNLYSSASDYPQYGTVDITNEYARNITLALIESYAAFFRTYGNSSKFNLGCDEVRGTLSTDAFNEYINEAAELLQSMGYSVRAFNDSLFAPSAVALDANLELCVWTDSSNADIGTYLADNRKLYNCIENYCYYALRNNATQGDARSETCAQWSFHHASAERIFSGCGGTCSFSACNQSGGWNPSHFYTYYDTQETIVTDAHLGGGYFLIWGDWAGWCSEEAVWNGIDEEGTYNLPERLRASAAKMWNWDADAQVSYATYAELLAAVGNYPGFTDCKGEPLLPEGKQPHPAIGGKTQLTVICKTVTGTQIETFTEFQIEAEVGSYFIADLPQLDGYHCFAAQNAFFRGSDYSTLYGLCGTQKGITVWYLPNGE